MKRFILAVLILVVALSVLCVATGWAISVYCCEDHSCGWWNWVCVAVDVIYQLIDGFLPVPVE